MVPTTRRTLLQAATAAVCGLAGCGQLTASSSSGGSTSESEHPPDSMANTDSDPSLIVFRADSETEPIRVSGAEPTPTPGYERRHSRVSHAVVDTIEKGRSLTVADGFDERRVVSFVEATDFDSQTLYLEHARVEQCFRLQLCEISWTPTEIRTDYARRLRPYDEECAVDTYVVESRLIRLDDGLDEASVNSFASSVSGSGECDESGRGDAEGEVGSGMEPGSSPNSDEGGGAQ